MFSMGAADIRRGSVQLVSRGIWSAEIEPIEGVAFTAGQRVELALGNLPMRGAVLTGGFFTAGDGFFVVGGAGGWRKKIARRPYRDEQGVKLVDVARDLGQETGETVSVDSSLASTIIGPAWTRPEGTAALALDDLGYPWRVLPDGTTTIGPLPSATTDALLSLRRHYPATGVSIVEFPDDELAGVVPGTELELDDVSLRAWSTRVVIEIGGKVYAEASA